MSLKQGSAFSIGELLGAGVRPYTREAASLVAEVCRQVFYADNQIAPTASDILLGSDGSLTISGAGSASAEDQMPALAALLELLLPPLGSTEPDFAVRASLRILAPRARGTPPGLAPISAPESLAAELSRYAPPDPTGVLRELWSRGDRALHHYLPSPRNDEPVTNASIRVALEASSASSHRHRRPFWIPLTAAAVVTMGFAGGGWLGRRSYEWTSRFVAGAGAHHSSVPPSHHTMPPHRPANSGSAGERAVAPVHGTDTSAAEAQAPTSVSRNTNAGVLSDATDETLHRRRPVDRVAEQPRSVHRDRTANRTAAEPIANTHTEAAAPPLTPTPERAANPVATPQASQIRESVPVEAIVATPPLPSEVSTPPSSPAAPTEEQQITATLHRYAAAYQQLDANAARTVWPTVDERALARAFNSLESQEFTFEACNVRVVDRGASAACRGSVTYVPKVGGRTAHKDDRQWNFELHKQQEVWLITRATMK
jgi:hypothetical protein